MKKVVKRPTQLQNPHLNSTRKRTGGGFSVQSEQLILDRTSTDEFPSINQPLTVAIPNEPTQGTNSGDMNIPAEQSADSTTQDTAEVFTLQPEMAAEMQRLMDKAAASMQPLSTETRNSTEVQDNAVIAEQPEMAVETMNNTGATNSEEGRVLRSAGKELHWNPELGGD